MIFNGPENEKQIPDDGLAEFTTDINRISTTYRRRIYILLRTAIVDALISSLLSILLGLSRQPFQSFFCSTLSKSPTYLSSPSHPISLFSPTVVSALRLRVVFALRIHSTAARPPLLSSHLRLSVTLHGSFRFSVSFGCPFLILSYYLLP